MDAVSSPREKKDGKSSRLIFNHGWMAVEDKLDA
jgi:hypothetical protein